MKKTICLIIYILSTAFFVTGCLNESYGANGMMNEVNYDYGTFMVRDAYFTEKIVIDENLEYVAENGCKYAVISMDIKLKSGNWGEIKRFHFNKSESGYISCELESDIMKNLNGKDIFTIVSADKQQIMLVFNVKTATSSENINNYNLQIELNDGSITKKFTMEIV